MHTISSARSLFPPKQTKISFKKKQLPTFLYLFFTATKLYQFRWAFHRQKKFRSCYFNIRNKIPHNGDKLPIWEGYKTFFLQLYLVIKRAEMKNILRQQRLSRYKEPKKLERCKDDTRKFGTVGMSEGSELLQT